MSEKRFVLCKKEDVEYIEDNGCVQLYGFDVLCDLLNEQQKTIKKQDIEIQSLNLHIEKLVDGDEISQLLMREYERSDALEKENEQLRQQLQEYKENWDDMVELATKTSLRNIELDEQIGQLQRENEMLKKEIERLNGLLFGTPKEAIE